MASEAETVQLLHRSIERGINTFDTSPAYGRSEVLIGKALAGRRADAVICTKCPHLRDQKQQFFSDSELKAIIANSITKSLKDLKTDYVDVYMIHNADPEMLDHPVIIDRFSQLKRRGLTRTLGVTVYTVQEARKAIEGGFWQVIQLPFNLLDQRHAQMFEEAARKGIGIFVRSVLCKGVLTDRNRFLHPKLAPVREHCELYLKKLNTENFSLSDIAAKFALSFREVSSVLIGIDKTEYLEKAIALADGHYFSEDQLKLAKTMAYPEPDFLDFPLWAKKGWLK
jgi:aryl-alcohol dehydrogenase-like predicted oxidoreductase